jgi:hypothetical protein
MQISQTCYAMHKLQNLFYIRKYSRPDYIKNVGLSKNLHKGELRNFSANVIRINKSGVEFRNTNETQIEILLRRPIKHETP